MKIRIIHHSADWDGKLSGAIAHYWLRDFTPDIEMVPWDFGNPPIPYERVKDCDVIILDLPCDAPFGAHFPDDISKTLDLQGKLYGSKSLVWIDHHKSSIETHPQNIPGYRIDGVAACRLAWQWFAARSQGKLEEAGFELPTLSEYINRQVSEPLAVRLAGEQDVWDHRDQSAAFLNVGLTATPDPIYASLFAMGNDNYYTIQIIEKGKVIIAYLDQVNAEICKSRVFQVVFENLTFFCVNSARFNSALFKSVDHPQYKHDALMGFCFDGKGWLVSLYHSEHRKDIDLSEIAKKYGGGGHRGACGFRCKELPFAL